MIRVAINGACGRMGKQLVSLCSQQPDMEVVGLWEAAGSPHVGTREQVVDLTVTEPFASKEPDVIIDFTNQAGFDCLMEQWGDRDIRLVSGTTGISQEGLDTMRDLSRRTPMFWAPNMSVGVAVLRKLLRTAAASLDAEWDAEIVEMHHKRKKDAPSGTAIALAEELEKAWPVDLKRVYGREGDVGARGSSQLGIMAVRGGDVVGEHEVILAGPQETLRLEHRAVSRQVFANGAVRATRWLMKQVAGLYGMDDLAG